MAEWKDIKELNKRLDLLLDKKQVFIRGIIRGVGIAIGATIVATLALWIITAILSNFFDPESVRGILESSK